MYTIHGLMTGEDYAEYLKNTDQGTTDVYLDDVPEWFDVPAECPICPIDVAAHEAFGVTDASGEIFACLVDEWYSKEES